MTTTTTNATLATLAEDMFDQMSSMSNGLPYDWKAIQFRFAARMRDAGLLNDVEAWADAASDYIADGHDLPEWEGYVHGC